MKTSFFTFILLISISSFSQQTSFTIAAGAQRTLTAAERTLSLKNLELGDDCTIIIPASMDGWTVTASEVTIGKNVKITGMGVNGQPGGNGMNGASGANCMNGAGGVSGGIGSNGTAGKNVSLSLRIRQIGSLTILVNGGNGGNGGFGGTGGKGGNATCTCDAGNGGGAGYGGRGGNGGNGGNVTISYTAVGNTTVSNSNFIIQNVGGQKGSGGGPGGIGLGGKGGGCTDPKALVRANGTNGSIAGPGIDGTQGANGVTSVKHQ